MIPGPGVEGVGFCRGTHPGIHELVYHELRHVRGDGGFEEAPGEVEVPASPDQAVAVSFPDGIGFPVLPKGEGDRFGSICRERSRAGGVGAGV